MLVYVSVRKCGPSKRHIVLGPNLVTNDALQHLEVWVLWGVKRACP